MSEPKLRRLFDRSQVVVGGVALAMLGCFVAVVCLPNARALKSVGAELAAAEQHLATKMHEVKELPDGYALRLPLEPGMIMATAEFISMEQKCCGFFGFSLELAPNNGPMWLSLTGGAGAKEFLQAEMGLN